jgi:hypothetical protein
MQASTSCLRELQGEQGSDITAMGGSTPLFNAEMAEGRERRELSRRRPTGGLASPGRLVCVRPRIRAAEATQSRSDSRSYTHWPAPAGAAGRGAACANVFVCSLACLR